MAVIGIGFPVQTRVEEWIARKVSEIVYRGIERRVCGYTDKDVPPQYKVVVRWKHKNKAGALVGNEVNLILQEDVSLGVESFWKSFVNPYSAVSESLSTAFQAISGGRLTAFHKVATRRIWTGTTPIKLSLNLKVVAKDDAEKEVVEPVKLLSSLALPREAIAGFMAPPGPTPFSFSETFKAVGIGGEVQKAAKAWEEKGMVTEEITIQVGLFLIFTNVVVKSVDARFHSKFTPKGYPIAADVNIVFETYQVLTREEFANVFKAGQVQEQKQEK